MKYGIGLVTGVALMAFRGVMEELPSLAHYSILFLVVLVMSWVADMVKE